MIELNKEHTYKDICKKLEWSYQPSSNKTKQKQINCIEESFEFFHPINPKTHKEKKSYVFTKMIKEPILEDNRKNNGGFREAAGRKILFPNEEFDFLWKVMVSEAYKKNKYVERSRLDKVYFSNTLLFEMFGFHYGYYLDKAGFETDDKIVKFVFQDIVYSALKANTVTRLCKRYGFPKNNLPKGILRSRSRERLGKMIDDDALLDMYNEFEKEALKKINCSSVIEAVKQGKYEDLRSEIQSSFQCKQKYNVQKLNVVQVVDFDVIANGEHFGHSQWHLIDKYRNHFKEVIFASVEKSCLNRIKNDKKYKLKLNESQKQLLRKYLYNMLGQSETTISFDNTDTYDGEEFEWLNYVV